jgi:hypothetical protein
LAVAPDKARRRDIKERDAKKWKSDFFAQTRGKSKGWRETPLPVSGVSRQGPQPPRACGWGDSAFRAMLAADGRRLMPGRKFIGVVSVIVLIGLTALTAYGIWFCAGALHGDPAGCVASAGGATLRSPPVLIAAAAAAAGLIYSTLPRR